MQNLVNKYIEKFTHEKAARRRLVQIILVLALMVTVGVYWQLKLTGAALANEYYCGLKEHTHTDDCYEMVLVCGVEEGETSADPEDGAEGHSHTNECYEKQLICGQTEHTHTAECLIDETADVENEEDWEATLPELTGVWADDVVAIAASQIGYAESTANYTIADDGETHKGYTRYGAWAGNIYGDWDAMFASFCLYYAEIPAEDFPEAAGTYEWTVTLQEMDLYEDAASYTPVSGDLVFFDTGEDGKADRVGIVREVNEEKCTITVIEGNYEDAVCENIYSLAASEAEVETADEETETGTVKDEAESESETAASEERISDKEIIEEETEEEIEKEVEEKTSKTVLLDGSTIVGYGCLPEQEDEVLTATDTDAESGTESEMFSEKSSKALSVTLYSEAVNGILLTSTGDEGVIATLTATDVTAVSELYLWIWDKSETKIAGYSEWDSTSSGSNYSSDGISDALTYTDSDSVTWYLIPLSYFESALDSYGFSFDTGECPFQYAADATATGTRTDAYYVSVDGTYYVRVQDTTSGQTLPRTNIYYTKYKIYSVVEDTVSPSGTVINLFDYWTTGQTDADYGTNSDTGINADHTLKFSWNGKGQWTNYVSGSALQPFNYNQANHAVYPGIVANLLVNGYPYLNSQITQELGSSSYYYAGTDYTAESLAYLFDPTSTQDGKASYSKVTGLLQVDDDGYYYYDSTKNYAEFDESTNSFTLYDDWAVYTSAGSNEGQFFPFDSLDSLGTDPQTKTCNATDLNHYFGMTLTTKFVQQYDGYTTPSQKNATTFEFAGDDDVWIFMDGVLVADLGGIHGSASVTIDFSTGIVSITGNGTTTHTIYQAYVDAGVAANYSWNDDTNPTTYANNTYHTLKFFYMERGNSASDLTLKYNLPTIPETGIYKVDQYGEPIEGAEFAVYSATVDSNGDYYYLYDDGNTGELATEVSAKLQAGTYTFDSSKNICDSNGNVIISAKYVGTTDANGELVFIDEDEMLYSMSELEDLFGEYFILKETKVPDNYRMVSEDVYLQIYNGQVMVCNNTYESGVYASTSLLVSATDELYLYPTDGSSTYKQVDYYDVTNETVNGTLFAVVLKYVGDDDPSTDSDPTHWVPVYGSDEDGYTVMDSYSLANVITAAQEMESNGYSASVFSLSGSGAMQVYLTALPGAIRTYYYLAEDKSTTQYVVAFYYTTEDSLDDATASNTSRVLAYETDTAVDYVDSSGNTGSVTNYSGFYRTFGATINVPNLSNALLVQKMDEDGNLINGAKFAMYKVEEVKETVDVGNGGTMEVSTIYYIGYSSTDTNKTTPVYIYLSEDTDGNNEGGATLKDGTTTGTYSINPGEGPDGETNEGIITVTIGCDTYFIYPAEVETTMAAGTQVSDVTGITYDTSEDGTAVFDELNETTYYVREIEAPAGYRLNTTEVMVLVTGDTIYANAGTVDDGVTVARAAGFVVATLDQMAVVGDIDNTLSWIYTTMHVNKSQLDTFSFDSYSSASSSWSTLLNDSSATQHAYLTYDENQTAALFNYVVNTDRSSATGYTGTRRLYTDVGWSYLEIYQDTEYHQQRVASGTATSYAYTTLTDPITNLFSRSVYIQVTDSKDYTMPSTGGTGAETYIFAGILLCGAALLLFGWRRRLAAGCYR